MNAIVELNDGLGAVFAAGGAFPFGLFGGVIGAVALGFFALWQSESNDDDDSSPGGGLMQPVALSFSFSNFPCKIFGAELQPKGSSSSVD